MTPRTRRAAPRMALSGELLRFCAIAIVAVTLATTLAVGTANAGIWSSIVSFFGGGGRSPGDPYTISTCNSQGCYYEDGRYVQHIPGDKWANTHHRPMPRQITGSGSAARQSDGAEYQSCPC